MLARRCLLAGSKLLALNSWLLALGSWLLAVGRLSLEAWPWPWSHRFGWVPLRVQCYMVGGSDIICWCWAFYTLSWGFFFCNCAADRVAFIISLLFNFNLFYFSILLLLFLTYYGFGLICINVKNVPIKIAENMFKTLCKFWWKHKLVYFAKKTTTKNRLIGRTFFSVFILITFVFVSHFVACRLLATLYKYVVFCLFKVNAK